MSHGAEPAGDPAAPGSDRDAFYTSVAHSARVHDYWLGGKDNYAADQAAGDAVMRPIPEASCPCAARPARSARPGPAAWWRGPAAGSAGH